MAALLSNTLAGLKRHVVTKQFATPLGITLLALLGVVGGYLAADDQALIPFLIGGVLIGVIIVYYILTQPLVGFHLTIILAFFSFYPGRMLDKSIPISTGIEVLIILLLLSSFARQSRQKGTLMKSPITIAFIVYTFFFLIQFFNPDMFSRAGYFLYFRRFAMFIFIYIISYRLIDTREKLKSFIHLWIVLSFITSLYGCYQQFFGLLPFEMHSLMKDPHEFKLMFQGGMIRKMSFLSDAVAFGMQAGSMALFTLIIAIAEQDKKKRRMLFFFAVIMVMGMQFAGTRTTTIILPAGMALYGFMTINNKRTLMVLFSFIVIAMGIFFAPIHTPALNRMRTTFNKKDASLNVRDENRKYIQPYIYKHPLGGGIATSGIDGVAFNLGHPLAGFPPDSGLLKYAIETGWIGYTLVMLFHFIMVATGIGFFFRSKDPEMKTYIMAVTAMVFVLICTMFSQVSIGQIPAGIFFYGSLALLSRMKEFSDQHEAALAAKNGKTI